MFDPAELQTLVNAIASTEYHRLSGTVAEELRRVVGDSGARGQQGGVVGHRVMEGGTQGFAGFVGSVFDKVVSTATTLPVHEREKFWELVSGPLTEAIRNHLRAARGLTMGHAQRHFSRSTHAGRQEGAAFDQFISNESRNVGERIAAQKSMARLGSGDASAANDISDPEPEYDAQTQPWFAGDFPKYEDLLEAELAQRATDVVLVVAVDSELRAVLHRLTPLAGSSHIIRNRRGPNTYYCGMLGQHTVAVVKCDMGSLSRNGAILATQAAISAWLPRAVIMVGIAFGATRTSQKLGDVLVSSQVISYEPQRIGHSLTFRGPIVEPGIVLKDRFSNAQDWNFQLPWAEKGRILLGPILSGEKLFDNAAEKNELLKHFPQAIGGEMEAVGIQAAAGREGCEWIVVKGVCDWADGKKTNRHHELAAAAALSLVEHVLSSRTALEGIAPHSRAAESQSPPSDAHAQELIAIGAAIMVEAKNVSIDKDYWVFEMGRFVRGNLNDLLVFISELDVASHGAYVLSSELGDGRPLSQAPSLTKEDGVQIVKFPLAKRVVRSDASGHSDVALDESGDIFPDLRLVAGRDAAIQQIRVVLGTMEGPLGGSTMGHILRDFRSSPLLNVLLKLEVIRLATVPASTHGPAFSFVDNVSKVNLVSEDSNTVTIFVDLVLHGEGPWSGELKVFRSV